MILFYTCKNVDIFLYILYTVIYLINDCVMKRHHCKSFLFSQIYVTQTSNFAYICD